MWRSVLKDKSYAFAVDIIKLVQSIQNTRKEFIVSKQLIRSGTAIGAMVREARFAQSKPDFIHKMSIALKEANETNYWLDLLYDTGYLTQQNDKLWNDCDELVAILAASVKTAKDSIREKNKTG